MPAAYIIVTHHARRPQNASVGHLQRTFVRDDDSAEALRTGDFGAAWFAAHLAESPKGALAAEAAGRLIQAHQGAGRTEQDRVAAPSYLQHYATGPYAALARSLTDEKSP